MATMSTNAYADGWNKGAQRACEFLLDALREDGSVQTREGLETLILELQRDLEIAAANPITPFAFKKLDIKVDPLDDISRKRLLKRREP